MSILSLTTAGAETIDKSVVQGVLGRCNFHISAKKIEQIINLIAALKSLIRNPENYVQIAKRED